MCGYTYYINFRTEKNLKQKKLNKFQICKFIEEFDFSKHINIGKNHFFHNSLK